MKLRKRIVSLGATLVMAVSMMSFGASASKLYSTQTATRNNLDYEYGVKTPHLEKSLVYSYYGTRYTLGKLYSRVKTGGFFTWTAKAEAGAVSSRQSAQPYSSIVVNGSTKSVSDDAKFNKGIKWTDPQVSAKSSYNNKVVFKIHCWY